MSKFRSFGAVVALFFVSFSQSAVAQGAPGQAEPLEFPALDARGVDQPTGASAFNSPSISIGNPGSGGLSYHQEFIGGGAGGASGDWRHSIIGGITANSTSAKVTLLSGVERFTVSGGVYTPEYATGSALSYNTGTGVYTYTLPDGTVAEFDSELTNHETTYGAEDGLITSLTRPNGLKWEYHYDSAQVRVVSGPPTEPIITFEGPFYRLQSVTLNTGYQLHLEYETQSIGTIDGYDEWLNVTKVQLINNAVDYCAPLAHQCTGLTQSWPQLVITEPSAIDRRYTDVLGDATTFRTDSGGRVTRVTDPAGLQTLISYSGGLVSSISTGGLTWSYAYSDSDGVRTTTTTGPGGAATATLTETDLSTGLVVASEDALGARTEYTHDSDKRLTRVTFPEGDFVTYAYDGRGNVITVTRHQRPGSDLPSVGPLTMSATYPPSCANPATCNQPASTTDAAGHTTTYTYFSHGGVNTITAPEPAPGLDTPQTRVIYAAQTAYYKNSAGVIAAAPSSVTLPVERRSCRIGELSTCQGTANERRTLMTYGSAGVANNLHVTQVQEQLGNGGLAAATQMTYTAAGDVATVDGPVAGSGDTVHYRYDARRRLVGEIGPDPDGAGPRHHAASRTTYDAAGRVTEQEAGTVTGTTGAAWAAFTRLHRQTVEYDTLGRPEIARAYDSGSTVLALA
ncbi:MAG: hypothetical protein RKE49_09180 [Oceanicaulis sp.]